MKKIGINKLISFFTALGIMISFTGCAVFTGENEYTLTSEKLSESTKKASKKSSDTSTSSDPLKLFSLSDIPDYDINPYIIINDNIPYFTESEKNNTKSFEIYSDLDELSRCSTAYACIGTDIMPTEERGKIGSIKPSGWHSVKYDNIDGKYLYNRCHLIGYQLSGENANEKNLITGTRYMNTEGMLPFENMVADYVKETNLHVLYRVTPIFDGDNLLCCGVLMEAYSTEDEGDGICFNVFCYNVQPGISIDYTDGSSELNSDKTTSNESKSETFIINTNTKKFHKTTCSSVKNTKKENKKTYTGTRKELIQKGYEPCKTCKP